MINYTCIMRLKSACGTRKLVDYNLRSTRGWRYCALPDVLALVCVRTPDEPANSHSRFSCHVSFVHCSATSLLSVTMKLSNAMSADIDHSSRPIAACCQTTQWYKFLLRKNKANFVFQESTRWIQIAWFHKKKKMLAKASNGACILLCCTYNWSHLVGIQIFEVSRVFNHARLPFALKHKPLA